MIFPALLGASTFLVASLAQETLPDVTPCPATDLLVADLLDTLEPVGVIAEHEGRASFEESFVLEGEDMYFVGCNHTHFDLYDEETETLLTFLNEDVALDDCNAVGCQCYFLLCVGGSSSGHGHGGHGRSLQHDHDEDAGHGDFLHSNHAYYLTGHTIRLGHFLGTAGVTTCEGANEDASPHHACDLSAVTAPVAEAESLNCSTTTTTFMHHFEGLSPVHEVGEDGEHHHDDDHGDEENEDHDHDEGKRLHEEEMFFVGCNNTHFDVFHDESLYTYELSFFHQQTTALGGQCKCFLPLCREASEHDHEEEHDDGDEHDHGLKLKKIMDVETDFDFSVNAPYYIANYVIVTAEVAGCCGTFDISSVATAAECDLDEFLPELVVAEEEPISSIAVITIGVLAAVALALVLVVVFAPSKKEATEVKEAEPLEEIKPAVAEVEEVETKEV